MKSLGRDGKISKLPRILLFAVALAAATAAALPFRYRAAAVISPPDPTEPSMSFILSSPSFPNGGAIDKKFTCDGADVSPHLTWSNAPANTMAFALLADDPDAPMGNWNHWAIWNVPSTLRSLPEGLAKTTHLPDGSEQGMNDFHKPGYNGPCPPAGKPHRYYFKLFALDTKLSLNSDVGKPELEKAMNGHILAHAEWMGTYKR